MTNASILDETPEPIVLCGEVSEDYPELVCEYPKGHGIINEPEDDVFGMEHGAPSRGGWFSNYGPPIPEPTVEEKLHAVKKDALESVLELLSNDTWIEPSHATENRLKLAQWLQHRIELFDRGVWSAIPGGEEADIARANQD